MLNRRYFATTLALAPYVVASAADAAPGPAPPGHADFPNVALLNQHSQQLRFFDDVVRGDRTIVINFIYAQCGDICPMTMANLSRVQELLGDKLVREVHIASISIDPVRDSPAVLKGYADRFDARPGWQFLTGRPIDIDKIRRKLGAYDRNPAIDRDKTQHTGLLTCGNQARGRWSRVSALADPRLIFASITRWTWVRRACRCAAP